MVANLPSALAAVPDLPEEKWQEHLLAPIDVGKLSRSGFIYAKDYFGLGLRGAVVKEEPGFVRIIIERSWGQTCQIEQRRIAPSPPPGKKAEG